MPIEPQPQAPHPILEAQHVSYTHDHDRNPKRPFERIICIGIFIDIRTATYILLDALNQLFFLHTSGLSTI